jgi:phosphatidylserine/phosphatidylglycerophosphate/cardiolipin synthase-like enzyme
MRKRKTNSGLTVNAIAGTHVVVLGLDLSDAKRVGCLGFAIQREDHTEDEKYWMSGMKTFAATDPLLGPGGQVSSRDHPFQSFQWSDYSAKPDHDYTYTVIPLFGTPASLTEGTAASVRVHTEVEVAKPHSVFFNRGAVATQEYARRFQNKAPSELEREEKQAAYLWLSRGLLKALTNFIARANSDHFEIFAAVYEFQWPEVLQALKAAANTGAKVRIIYDAIPSATGPKEKNETAISDEHVKGLCSARTIGTIMHNKFFVLVKDGQPIAVWTGSTNLTENGIFGHSNCGHIVEDNDVAETYVEYWKQLKKDKETTDDRDWVAANNANPPDPLTDNPTVLFSPRSGLSLLKRYSEIANGAQDALFMTFAFGMHKLFKDVYEQSDGVLRFALMESEGNGASLAQAKIDIRRIRNLPNVVVAIGYNIATNSFDRWVQERRNLSSKNRVHWIHTKYMLVDPLGAKPIVITGSANFSEPSTNANHENMLIVRDDTRVADIYLGEFMRLHSHYAFREAVKIAADNGETDWHPQHLDDTDGWQKDYYDTTHQRFHRRKYFAQT